ncbi:hypothetical protein CMO83_04580 [Candidatus Woesearchaeota archaeon]|nr:hypothetical protein [Candidatus Woesearchaeota archaeon]
MGDWQNYMTEKINSLPGADFVPGPGALAQPGIGSLYPILPSPDGTSQSDDEQKTPLDGRRDGLAGYMDPNNNLFVAGMFGCIPGIVTGLEKYRQIKCLYADCLENAVAQDGLPITACENLKSHATCKYIYGEVFAAIPYTAVFDHFTGIIKEALSNPFTAAGIGIGAACYFTCPQPPPGASAGYIACAGFRVASKLGEVLTNVRGLVDEGFKPRQDYCSRLDFSDVDSSSTDQSSSDNTQSSNGVPDRAIS